MLGIKRLESREDKWRYFETEAWPYRADLYRVAMWLTKDSSAAEELVQETMFQALKSFHLYERGTNCKAWLMRILYNHNSRRLKKEMRLQIVDDPDEELLNSIPFEPPVAVGITDEEILGALWRLPATYRSVVILADIEELSYKEIASVLEIRIGTVMSRLSRGRRILQVELAGYSRQFGFSRASFPDV